MKKNVILLFLLAGSCMVRAQTAPPVAEADPIAILLLDRMSSVIGEMNACYFKMSTAYDVPDNSFFAPLPGIGLVKHFDEHEVYMTGPDKMLINSNGDKGHRGFWYSGELFAYYSYKENNYSYIEAPGNIIDVIHTLHANYDLEFPAADFFYPTFVDDLMQNSTRIAYLGTSSVNGVQCFHIAAKGRDKSTQFWISDDARTLPVKFVVHYLDHPERPQYEATFSEWDINPEIPATFYEFVPPPTARQIRFFPKNQN